MVPRQAPNTPAAHEHLVNRTFNVVVTQDEDGWFVGRVPELRGCHSQGKTVKQLKERIKEAILLCLEDPGGALPIEGRFVGIEDVTVEV